MDIDQSLIKQVASVARLDLSESEIKRFTEDFRSILDAFKKLDEVDVKGLDVSVQPIDLGNVTRDDLPKSCLSQEQALSNTPLKKDGFFKGPKVV